LINSPEILKEYRQAGAEMVGIAIDASTQQIFEKYRGMGVGGPHKWQKYWEVLKWSVEIFGKYKAGIHLIAGLGETEKEAVTTIYNAHVLGAKTHLFSFYPEAQSGLENLSPPELISYRKIQIARYLINDENLDISKINFDQQGRIISFDYDIRKTVEQGYAFMTSGCPCSTNSSVAACNRPFANERPSEPFRNYPYIPSEDDKILIAEQISKIMSLKN
jgi:biotin synthase